MNPEGDPRHRPFPSEDEWLALPPPQVAADFVERTLQHLRAAGLCSAPAGDPDEVPPLPPHLLASHAVPEPSPDFVARTFARVQHDRAARLRGLLLRYTAPEPTPDFVRRTLAALQGGRSASRTDLPPWRWFVPLLGLAAAIVLSLLLLRPSQRDPLIDLLATAPAAAAYAQGPTVLGHLLAPTAMDTLQPPDGAALWLLAEGRR